MVVNSLFGWAINQVQEEILTLKAVLNTKMKVAGDLRRKLGITPITELRQSIQNIKESGTLVTFRIFSLFLNFKLISSLAELLIY